MNKDHIPLSISLNQARIGFAPKDIFVGMSCFSIWDLVLKGGCFICTSKRFARERERGKSIRNGFCRTRIYGRKLIRGNFGVKFSTITQLWRIGRKTLELR